MKASQCSGDLYWIKPWIETFWSNYSGTQYWLTGTQYFSTCGRCSTNDQKAPQHLENHFAMKASQGSSHLYWIKPWIQTFWSNWSGSQCWLTRSEYLSTWISCSIKDQKVHQHLENRFCHEGKSMFWRFILNQTMNTDFLIQLQWYTVLTDWIWIFFHLRKLHYQRSEGSSTLGKPVLPSRKVNVLAIYSESNHEYRLSDPTAVIHNADWLDLNTFPPVEDALPSTRRLLNTWKKWFHREGNSIHHEYTLAQPTAVAYSLDWLHQNTSPSVETVRTGLLQYIWPEHWLALMAKPVFQVLRSLLLLGSSCLMGEKVSSWSQSAMCTVTVGSESLCSWVDLV